MNITPENVLSAEHESWLKHPATVQLVKNLEKHKQTFIKTLSGKSGDANEPELTFRLSAYGIRTTDAILTMIKETRIFVEQSTK